MKRSSISRFPVVRLAAYVWACPWTVIGLAAGVLAWLTGGTLHWRRGVLECSGGLVSWLLRHGSLIGPVAAVTLGHAVLGASAAELDQVRAHELVHVRQYERWGVLFVPVYLACSLLLALRRRDWYHDNPFEREAFRLAEESERGVSR